MMLATKDSVPVIINSRYRTDPADTPSDFSYMLNRDVVRISSISIDYVEIPYTFYVISTVNNVLTFDGGLVTVTITPGNYTAATLCGELTTKMTAAFVGQTITVTYSTTSMKLTINKNVAFTVDPVTSYPLSTLAPFIGFTELMPLPVTSAVGMSALNISGPNYLTISSSFLIRTLHYGTVSSGLNTNDVLFVVPIHVNPGNAIVWDLKQTHIMGKKMGVYQTDIIDIQLRDEFGDIIDLNGVDWAMHLTFNTY